jgi:hypothetical protein
MRCRSIVHATAALLASVALLASGSAVAQTQTPAAQAQPQRPVQAPAPAVPPADAPMQAPTPTDCPDPEAAGAPVVDEATARQHEGVVPGPGRELPEGEPATPDTIAAPVPGALSNGTETEQAGTGAPCPPAGQATDLASDPEVLESMEPGITELGRSPPNILREESTLGLQQLIDRAHGGSTGITRPGGGTRQVEGQPPALQDGSAPRERIAPR